MCWVMRKDVRRWRRKRVSRRRMERAFLQFLACRFGGTDHESPSGIGQIVSMRWWFAEKLTRGVIWIQKLPKNLRFVVPFRKIQARYGFTIIHMTSRMLCDIESFQTNRVLTRQPIGSFISMGTLLARFNDLDQRRGGGVSSQVIDHVLRSKLCWSNEDEQEKLKRKRRAILPRTRPRRHAIQHDQTPRLEEILFGCFRTAKC